MAYCLALVLNWLGKNILATVNISNNFLFTFIFLELELARAQRLERCNHKNEEKTEFEEGKRNSSL